MTDRPEYKHSDLVIESGGCRVTVPHSKRRTEVRRAGTNRAFAKQLFAVSPVQLTSMARSIELEGGD